nr:phage tail tape measure protein [Escherichia coli]
MFGKEFGDDAQKLANNLPELRRQIELTQGAAAKGSMNRESDINKASLSAQWQLTKTGAVNAFSSAGETLRDPLMDIMLTVSKVVGSVRRWVEANPALVGSIMKVTAAIGALLVVMGGLMLSIGAVLGPMALVRLSFTSLAGERRNSASDWRSNAPRWCVPVACWLAYAGIVKRRSHGIRPAYHATGWHFCARLGADCSLCCGSSGRN